MTPRGELPPNAVARSRERAQRTFRDREDTWWSVYEIPRHEAVDERSEQCLIFESERIVRRVRDYPANWHDLAHAELEALSWRR
jgi:hypothetical protein